MIHKGRIQWLTRRCAMPDVTYENTTWPTLLLSLANLGFKVTDAVVKGLMPPLAFAIPQMDARQLDGVLVACDRLRVRDNSVMTALASSIEMKCKYSDPALHPAMLAKILNGLYQCQWHSTAVYDAAFRILERNMLNAPVATCVQTLRVAGRVKLPFSNRAVEAALEVLAMNEKEVNTKSFVHALYSASRIGIRDKTSAVLLLRIIDQRSDLDTLVLPDLMWLVHTLVALRVTESEMVTRLMTSVIVACEAVVDRLQLLDITMLYSAMCSLEIGGHPGAIVEDFVRRAMTHPALEQEWTVEAIDTLLLAATRIKVEDVAAVTRMLEWCGAQKTPLPPKCATKAMTAMSQFAIVNSSLRDIFQLHVAAATSRDLAFTLGGALRNPLSSEATLSALVRQLRAKAFSLSSGEIMRIMYDCLAAAKLHPASHRVADILKKELVALPKVMTFVDIHTILKYFVIFRIQLPASTNPLSVRGKIVSSILAVRPPAATRELCDIISLAGKLEMGTNVVAHVSSLILPSVAVLNSREVTLLLSALSKAGLKEDPSVGPAFERVIKIPQLLLYELSVLIIAVTSLSPKSCGPVVSHIIRMIAKVTDPPSLNTASCVLVAMSRLNRKMSATADLDIIVARNLTSATVESTTNKKDVVMTLVSLANMGLSGAGVLPVLEEKLMCLRSELWAGDISLAIDALTRLSSTNVDVYRALFELAVVNILHVQVGSSVLLLTAIERILAASPALHATVPSTLKTILQTKLATPGAIALLTVDEAVRVLGFPSIPADLVVAALGRVAQLAGSGIPPQTIVTALHLTAVGVMQPDNALDTHLAKISSVLLTMLTGEACPFTGKDARSIERSLKTLGHHHEFLSTTLMEVSGKDTTN